MDVSTFLRWAWPPNGAALQGINWRELLHNAVRQRVGEEPTSKHIVYHSEQQTRGTISSWCTTLTVTLDDAVYTFTGVPQYSQVLAIRCAAWRGMLEMCTGGILEEPAL